MAATPGYSLNWAARVVNELCQEYPRATKFVDAVYGFDTGYAARLLANHPKDWRVFKRLVHFADLWLKEIGETYHNPPEWDPATRIQFIEAWMIISDRVKENEARLSALQNESLGIS
jgi:hypothetical protein